MAGRELDGYRRQIQDGAELSGDEARSCAELLLDGEQSDEGGAAFLAALAERGETVVEITAFDEAILARACKPPASVIGTGVDLAGTGGSGLNRFNVSIVAAPVVAAQRVKVAKHGKRGSRRLIW